MEICPFCASENIFYSKKRSRYFCEDCENGFDTPATAKGVRVFLSYGHDKNAQIVKRIKDFLVENGYDVWIDSCEIPAGKDWRERITNGLIGSDSVISFLSSHSVRKPGVCLDELKIAVCLKRSYIQTILLENESEVEPPAMVCNTQWIDMSDWESVPQKKWDEYFNDKMKQVLDALSSEENLKLNEELEFLGNTLATDDNLSKQQRLLKQMYTGRGWLMDMVDSWLDNPSDEPFIIYGVPGSGKSAFSANLSQFNPKVLAAIFFEWDHPQLHQADNVIRLIAFKLAETLPDYRSMLEGILRDSNKIDRIKKISGAALFDAIIAEPLHFCIDGNREKKMIIFDGLDETTPEIADLMIDKAKYLPNWIKVLFTSRMNEIISSRMSQASSVVLDNALEHNIKDISEYISCRLGLDIGSDAIKKLAAKSEGSFMYAAAFCDAVKNGDMSTEDIETVPSGLNQFFYSFFKRVFKTREDYLRMRPLFELLCVKEDIPEEVIMKCLKLNKYKLWELRLDVKNLIVSDESSCGTNTPKPFDVIKFVHQSIRDWLTNPHTAGEFLVDVSGGYRQLARYSETVDIFIPENRYTSEFMELINTAKNEEITQEKVDEIQKFVEEKRQEMLEEGIRIDTLKALKEYGEDNYVKWLISGGEYDKAKEILLSSFDNEKFRQEYSRMSYTKYYSFFDIWKWADLFPKDYPMDELIEKLKEIALFPRDKFVGWFAHRSIQIMLLTLSKILDSGRFKTVFFSLIDGLSLASYFKSIASDDSETRDGWDKFYMARDASICIKKLDKAGVVIPVGIRRECEKMKLTYNYCNNKPQGGMFSGGSSGGFQYGILCSDELFKDVCVYEDYLEGETPDETIKALIVYYNTTSLRFYLANSIEEDMSFIKKCIRYRADLRDACRKAIEDILEKSQADPSMEAPTKNYNKRIAFISSLVAE